MSQAILLSFRKTGGVFNGVANYARIFKDKTFQQCLFNTFFYFVIQVPIMLVLALMLAQLLNNDLPSVCNVTGILFHDI